MSGYRAESRLERGAFALVGFMLDDGDPDVAQCIENLLALTI